MKSIIRAIAKAGASVFQWIDKTYRKLVPNKGYTRFLVFCGIAFAAALCFVHIDSHFADKNNVNGLLTVLGIILSLLAISLFIIGALEYEKDTKS